MRPSVTVSVSTSAYQDAGDPDSGPHLRDSGLATKSLSQSSATGPTSHSPQPAAVTRGAAQRYLGTWEGWAALPSSAHQNKLPKQGGWEQAGIQGPASLLNLLTLSFLNWTTGSQNPSHTLPGVCSLVSSAPWSHSAALVLLPPPRDPVLTLPFLSPRLRSL